MSRISDPHESEAGQQQLPSNGKTILLAEDDPFISRMYQSKLVHAGYTVVLVNNGRDAFEHIKNDHPDFVMLDINMPELSGFEVMLALQTETVAFDPNCIMVLTNSQNDKDRQEAARLGVEYITKAELTPQEVLGRINIKLGISSQPE